MKYFLFIIVCLLLLPIVMSYDTDEYLGEFSVEGESCGVIDIFAYNMYDPQWYKPSDFIMTIPTFYSCCKGDVCTPIIIDLEHKQTVFN